MRRRVSGCHGPTWCKAPRHLSPRVRPSSRQSEPSRPDVLPGRSRTAHAEESFRLKPTLHPPQWATKRLPVLRQTRTQQSRCAAGPEGGDVRGGRALAQEDLRAATARIPQITTSFRVAIRCDQDVRGTRAICRNTSARHAGEGTSRSARVSSRSSARAAWYARGTCHRRACARPYPAVACPGRAQPLGYRCRTGGRGKLRSSRDHQLLAQRLTSPMEPSLDGPLRHVQRARNLRHGHLSQIVGQDDGAFGLRQARDRSPQPLALLGLDDLLVWSLCARRRRRRRKRIVPRPTGRHVAPLRRAKVIGHACCWLRRRWFGLVTGTIARTVEAESDRALHHTTTARWVKFDSEIDREAFTLRRSDPSSFRAPSTSPHQTDA